MDRDNNTCIRSDRDEEQIERCREKVEEIKIPVFGLSRILSLIGSEVRMKILFLLREEGRLCVCDLSEILEMKIPAVSQHLRKLKDAELVFPEREGVTIYYHIDPKMQSTINTVFSLLPKAELV